MDNDPAAKVQVPPWFAKLEEWHNCSFQLSHDEIANLLREYRELLVAFNDLREDNGLTSTLPAYTVEKEYNSGDHYEVKTLWAGRDKYIAKEFAKTHLASLTRWQAYTRCLIKTWEDGKVVAERWLLCPGYAHCRTCNDQGIVHRDLNYTNICTVCHGIGIAEKEEKT